MQGLVNTTSCWEIVVCLVALIKNSLEEMFVFPM